LRNLEFQKFWKKAQLKQREQFPKTTRVYIFVLGGVCCPWGDRPPVPPGETWETW